MAAWPDNSLPETVDLQRLPAGSLDAVLDEETRTWRESLCWDFAASAGLVKRFVDMQSLGGVALLHRDRVIGYTYTVVEEDKGLIGDLYILRDFATPAMEEKLLNATVESLGHLPGIRRIEAQVILMGQIRSGPLALAQHLHSYERCFMSCPVATETRFAAAKAERLVDLELWEDRHLEEAAGLIADAYVGHVDGQINDQYRSRSGARKFLHNIVQYPGCGAFEHSASWLAWRRRTGRLCALSLASLVAHDTGHITQICVSPEARGEGIGRVILTRSLQSLKKAGCKQISLTVTASNRNAIALYESLGFAVKRRFAAMVWENVRPPRRYFL